jgi:hypothetical protein
MVGGIKRKWRRPSQTPFLHILQTHAFFKLPSTFGARALIDAADCKTEDDGLDASFPLVAAALARDAAARRALERDRKARTPRADFVALREFQARNPKRLRT